MIAQDRIREISERIAHQFAPDQIILFGSYAYGTPDEGSDVDLLVVLPFEGKPYRKAAEIAATLDWSNDPWHALADALKAATGQKGRALFHPLRLALTGRDSGPEMAGLLKRVGKDRAVARLSAAASN